MSNELTLATIKVSDLKEFKDAETKQKQLLADNPFVEIIDVESYTEAKRSRTDLRKGRTDIQKQDKAIASKLSAFRKDVKTHSEYLIGITKTAEESQQEEVSKYEEVKRKEKEERDRLENERIEKIHAKQKEINTNFSAKIEKMSHKTSKEVRAEIKEFFDNLDTEQFEEFSGEVIQLRYNLLESHSDRAATLAEKAQIRAQKKALEEKEEELAARERELETQEKERIDAAKKEQTENVDVVVHNNDGAVEEVKTYDANSSPTNEELLVEINVPVTAHVMDAPEKVEFPAKHIEILFAIGKDHTGSIYMIREALAFLRENPNSISF